MLGHSFPTRRSSDLGHLVGSYAINFGYIGANASFYLQHPTCYDEAGAFDTSIGIRLFGYIADTFIDDAEVGRVNIGIQIDGRDTDGAAVTIGRGPAAHQDVRLSNCVVDSVSVAGLDIRDLNRSGQVSINDLYVAPASAKAIGIRIHGIDPGASIDFTAGKLLGIGGTGVAVSGAVNISMRGTYLREFGKPIVLDKVAGGLFEPKIYNASHPVGIAAIEAIDSHRTSYKPRIAGAEAMLQAGVSLDERCSHSSVDPTMIDPACLKARSAAYKVRYGAADARTSPAFTTSGNVLTGALA